MRFKCFCSVSQTLNERRKIPLFPRLNTQNIIGLQHMLYRYWFFFFFFVNGTQHSDISCQKWYYSFSLFFHFGREKISKKYDWFVFTFSNLTTWWWTWKMAPKNNIVTFLFYSIDSFLCRWMSERKSKRKSVSKNGFSTNGTMYEQR